MIQDMNLSSPFALFDGDEGRCLLLSGYRRALCAGGREDSDQLADVFAEVETAAEQGEWIALAADYGLSACFEPKAPSFEGHGSLFDGWVFSRAQWLSPEAVDAFLAEQLSRCPEHLRVAGIAELSPALDLPEYTEKVERIRRWITEGDCYQINLTFPLEFSCFGHPLALYAALRRRQPVRYGACLFVPGKTVLSFSPELFFERRGARVVTRPMKGTAHRGVTAGEDAENRLALLSSAKERAENIMIVDLLRNDLGRLAKPGRVRVESLCEAEAYPTVWQMVSTISADLPGVGLFDLFRALFPCGSITGAPKLRAMQCIAELESAPRGLYTGALGWLAPGGDCRFNVAIRTLEIDEKQRGRLGVGSGIVIDAQPGSEYAECLLKARFLSGFDPGFELIETMRFERGACLLLDLHMRRLKESAAALGFACDQEAIRQAVQAHASETIQGVCRVRLTLARSGEWRITSEDLAEDSMPKSTVVASELLDPEDYLLRHKTTARSRYDGILKSLAVRPSVFDAIFLNVRGEVCEGARSNVFVERDGMLLTPPTSCGLLPGVLRRHLLESGRAVERILRREDLLGDNRVYLGNALRGLIPVVVER